MQALLLEQPKAFRFIDIPEPPEPGPGEAVVRVHAVGICGTDYGGYLGKMPFFSYPRIPGHELGVEVVAVGPGVTNVRPGDRCCVEPYINCQQCSSCRRGLTNCCEHHQTLGVHCDGGLRPLFTVPARKLHPSPRLSRGTSATAVPDRSRRTTSRNSLPASQFQRAEPLSMLPSMPAKTAWSGRSRSDVSTSTVGASQPQAPSTARAARENTAHRRRGAASCREKRLVMGRSIGVPPHSGEGGIRRR